MQQTYHDRLTLNYEQLRWFEACGALYGVAQRKLYARIAKGDNPLQIKPEFCAQHGLSARQFNAMRMELQGKIHSTSELLKARAKELKQSIASVKRSIVKLNAKKKALTAAKLSKDLAALHPAALAKRRKDVSRGLFGKGRRLAVLQAKERKVSKRLKANVPGICFGSRKLFRQQFHPDLTDFGSGDAGQAAWKNAWTAARSHQFFLVGSKDETGGNQSCKAKVNLVGNEPTFSLLLKMPPALVAQGAPQFLPLDGLRFRWGHEQILAALSQGTALSYRFHRDAEGGKGWRVFVATDVADALVTTQGADGGVLGVDFNADHLALARIDRFGNPLDFGRVDLHLSHKTTAQRDAIMSQTLDRVLALRKGCPVAIEDLDFSAKKRELAKMGVKRARKLSGLAYAKYLQLARSKAARLGVELKTVDPAYTSVAGSIKYAVPLGCTVHQAAAIVIARRAQGRSEKLPPSGAQRAALMGRAETLTLPARNRCEAPRASWATIRKSLSRHCAEQTRRRKASSFGPGAAGNSGRRPVVSQRPLTRPSQGVTSESRENCLPDEKLFEPDLPFGDD